MLKIFRDCKIKEKEIAAGKWFYKDL